MPVTSDEPTHALSSDVFVIRPAPGTSSVGLEMELKGASTDSKSWRVPASGRFTLPVGRCSYVVRARRGDVPSYPSPPFKFIVTGTDRSVL